MPRPKHTRSEAQIAHCSPSLEKARAAKHKCSVTTPSPPSPPAPSPPPPPPPPPLPPSESASNYKCVVHNLQQKFGHAKVTGIKYQCKAAQAVKESAHVLKREAQTVAKFTKFQGDVELRIARLTEGFKQEVDTVWSKLTDKNNEAAQQARNTASELQELQNQVKEANLAAQSSQKKVEKLEKKHRAMSHKVVAKVRCYSLKSKGVIKPEMRDMVWNLVGGGVLMNTVNGLLQTMAKGFGLDLKDSINRCSVLHINREGGAAAKIQIVHKLKNAG
ncbi:hypothetical protein BOTBODRAFT_170621 [Botryobasidium botryosum FD-172 SS1]|uniref:Uncharacterized protein n=1 Tax=Botryobasidium botryosum (strain FD-172 SS1) TaxID=930990 RepID=A0A067N6Y1_BOTB1|nr:hypothetical protein BOTBODRAFT_170621 [Botryobasidium botryosum FD-172 SS1]